MDIQFALDVYTVYYTYCIFLLLLLLFIIIYCIYILYIFKAHKGMSQLLLRECDEAREGNSSIKQQVRDIGN